MLYLHLELDQWVADGALAGTSRVTEINEARLTEDNEYRITES